MLSLLLWPMEIYLYSKLKHKIISPVYPVAGNRNSSEADPSPKKYSMHFVLFGSIGSDFEYRHKCIWIFLNASFVI